MELIMISQTKKTLFNGLLIGVDSLRVKKCLLKTGCALLFSGLQSSYCMDHISSSSETPIDYYQCISGACNQTTPRLRGLESKYYLNMTPVKDQNPLGTCTTFAAGACVEYNTIRSQAGNQYYTPVSEAEFTVYAEQHTPGGDCKQGLNLGEALKVAKERGFIDEKYWLYPQYIEEVRELNGLSEEDEIDSSADICITNKYTESQLRRIPKFKLNNVRVISHIPRQGILTAFSEEVQRTPIRRSNRDLPLSFQSSHPNDDSIIPTIKAYIQKYNAPIAVSVATFGSWGNNAYVAMPTLKVAQKWSDLHLQRNTQVLLSDYHDNRFPNPSIGFDPGGYPSPFLTLTPSGWDYNINNRHSPYPFSSSFSPHSVVYDDVCTSSPFSKLTLSQNLEPETYKEGWHAIVLTGFDDNMSAFKFKNSWGKKWGNKGYGWLPYEYVKLYTSELVATF